MSPTERRTAETLFATPQRLGTACGGRRRNPLTSPPGLAGGVARQALEARLRAAGPSAATTPRRQDGGGGGGCSSPGALLAMLSSPEQPEDVLLAPNSEFRNACQCALNPVSLLTSNMEYRNVHECTFVAAFFSSLQSVRTATAESQKRL